MNADRRWLILLIAAGFVVRLWGAERTIPYVPDTQIVREALQLGVALAGSNFGGEIVTFKYPLVVPYALAGIYGAIFVAGRVLGYFSSLAAFQDFLFGHVNTFHLIAIALVAALNTAIVPVAYLAGERIYDERKGLLAAALCAFGLLNVHLSHQARPHAVVTLFLLLAFLASTLVLQRGRTSDYLLAGLAAGFAAGTLHNGFFGFAFFGAAHMLRWLSNEKAGGWLALLGFRFILGLAAGAIVALAGYPQLLTDPSRVLAVGDRGTVYLSAYHDVDWASFDVRRMADRLWALFNYEPVGVTLGLPGLVYGLWRARDRRAHALAAAFVLAYFALFAPLDYAEARFFTPLAPMLALMAANLALDLAGRVGQPGAAVSPKPVTLTFAALLLLPGLVSTLRLDWLLSRADTRELAVEWVAATALPGSPVLLDADVPLIPSRASLEQQDRLYPDSLGTKDRWLLGQPDRSYPTPNFDVYRLWIYQPATPEALRALLAGRTALGLFVRRTEFPPEGWLRGYVAERGEKAVEFSPANGAVALRDAALPADMSRALMDLWAVDRPGPVVEVYRFVP